MSEETKKPEINNKKVFEKQVGYATVVRNVGEFTKEDGTKEPYDSVKIRTRDNFSQNGMISIKVTQELLDAIKEAGAVKV